MTKGFPVDHDGRWNREQKVAHEIEKLLTFKSVMLTDSCCNACCDNSFGIC